MHEKKNVKQGYIELDEMWVFMPIVEGDPMNAIFKMRQDQLEHQIKQGRILEFDEDFLKEYEKVSKRFYELNGILEERYNEWRRKIV